MIHLQPITERGLAKQGLLDDAEKLVADVLGNKKRSGPGNEIAPLLTDHDFVGSFLTREAAANAGFVIGGGSVSQIKHVYVQSYENYIELTHLEHGFTIRWGVGIRWIVQLSKVDEKASFSIFKLAASAEFGSSEGQAQFSIDGLSSPAISSLTPTNAISLGVETISSYQSALDRIKNEIASPQTTVTPRFLSIMTDSSEFDLHDYSTAVVRTWALNRIKDGKRLEESLSEGTKKFKTGGVDLESEIRSVYLHVADISGQGEKVEDIDKARAKKLLMEG